MWAWVVENGLKIFWRIIWLVIPVTGWFVLNNYRLGESLAATQENKASIQKLNERVDTLEDKLSVKMEEIQRSLGRIEGKIDDR